MNLKFSTALIQIHIVTDKRTIYWICPKKINCFCLFGNSKSLVEVYKVPVAQTVFDHIIDGGGGMAAEVKVS